MNNLSLIILDGNLVADPEKKDLGKQLLTTFRVASNHEYGNTSEKKFVSYFQIECWNKLAQNCFEFLKKGNKVTIQGELRQDRWEDSSGSKKSNVKIIAKSVRFDSPKSKVEKAA